MTRLLGQKRDDELLSAYLDDELSAGERARLEARLAADPALQAELDALRRTVALLHELPPVPLPRNFILPQATEMRPRPAARPRRAWVAPLLTAAGAIASLLFVVVLAGDLLLSGPGRMALAPQPEAQVMEAPAAAEPTIVVNKTVEVEKAMPLATEPVEAVEAPREQPVEAAAEEEVYTEAPEDMAPLEATPESATAEEEAAAGAEPTPGEATGMGGGGVPTLTPAASLAVEQEPTTPEPAVTEAVAERAAATFSAPTAVAAQPLAPAEERGAAEEAIPPRPEAVRSPVSPWRIAEIVLALSALALVLVAIRAWRLRRR